MAKQTVKQDQADLGNEVLLLSEIQREWADILSKQQQSQVYDKERLKSLKSQYGTYDKLADRVREITDTFIVLNEEVDEESVTGVVLRILRGVVGTNLIFAGALIPAVIGMVVAIGPRTATMGVIWIATFIASLIIHKICSVLLGMGDNDSMI